MMLQQLVSALKEKTAWQKVPLELTDEEYINMVRYGLKTLYIDTGRALAFEEPASLPIDEERYVLLVSQIQFFKKVQTDVNNIVSYTTDALSVANADKPYANLSRTLEELERERRIVFYKMGRYAIG